MSSSDLNIQEITTDEQRGELLEAPHWDVARQSLYFVDIFASAIFRLDYKTGEIFRATIKDDDSPIGFFSPVHGTNDEFVIGANHRILLIKWDGKSNEATILKVVIEVDLDREGNRVNDGKVDPNGVLFFGSMGDEAKYDLGANRFGSLFSYTNETGLVTWKNHIGIGNGLTWDVKRKKFYYIDSVAEDVKEFDYDPATSKLCKFSIKSLRRT